MKRSSESEETLSKRPVQSAIESLSEPAIRRQLLYDALLRPATVLPIAVSVMSIIYLLVVSPVLGGGLWAIVLVVAFGGLAAASFVWRYVFRYHEEYTIRAQKLMALLDQERERLEQAEVRQAREALQAGFSSVDSEKGLMAFRGLVGGYEQLQPVLRHQRATDPHSMSYVPALAEESYRRGLSVLADALELMNAAPSSDRVRVESEIVDLEKEVDAAREGDDQAQWLRIKENRLASHRQHLDLLDQLRLRVDQLLFQAERCGASLHRTRIELAAIRTGNSERGIDSMIQALHGTINQVKEVQEELKRLGF